MQATAAVDLFVREEAVLPVTLGMRGASERDDGDEKEEATLAFSKVHAERLQGVLDEVCKPRLVLGTLRVQVDRAGVGISRGSERRAR